MDMLRKIVVSTIAVSALATASMMSGPANAAEGRHGAFAAGAAAGVLGGALLGSASRPTYEHERVYVEPQCRWHRERVYDGYEYRVRRVQVCD